MVAVAPGEQVRAARTRAQLSQRELARRSGVPQPHISAIESGRVQPTPPVIERLLEAAAVRPSVVLDRHRARVREIIARHGGTSARVFGSVARDEDTTASDIDLLISFPPGTSIFDIAALTEELTNLLGVPVDIVGDSGESGTLARARAEAVPV